MALNKASIYNSNSSRILPLILVTINLLKASHFSGKLLLLLIYVRDNLNSYNYYLHGSFIFSSIILKKILKVQYVVSHQKSIKLGQNKIYIT